MSTVRYVKETPRLTVQFVKESTNDIILEIPITLMEMQDFYKTDYVQSVLKNTFGDEKLKKIGDVNVIISQRFILTTT